jgi:hypothetical protein
MPALRRRAARRQTADQQASLPAKTRYSHIACAGYENVNDAERLRHNPAMRWIVGGKAPQAARLRKPDVPLFC